MTRRYREPVAMLEVRPYRRSFEAPARFRWRGRTYRVSKVLGFWREDAVYWARTAGGGIEVPQRDLWRVQVAGADGVCELAQEGGSWQVIRVWD